MSKDVQEGLYRVTGDLLNNISRRKVSAVHGTLDVDDDKVKLVIVCQGWHGDGNFMGDSTDGKNNLDAIASGHGIELEILDNKQNELHITVVGQL